MRLGTRVNLISAYFYLVILISFFGGYFSESIRSIYYGSSLTILFVNLFYLLYFLRKDYFKVNKSLFFIFGLLLIILLISLFLNLKINLIYIFIVCFFLFAYNIPQAKLNDSEFIKIINKTYVVYFLLSLLLYFNAIPSPIDKLNQFDYQIGGYEFKTFIGFFGSTSHIDSYSVAVFLLNVLLSQKRDRFIIVLTILAAILSLRSTPLLMLLVGYLTYLLRGNMILSFGLLLTLILSFLVPSLAHWVFNNDILDLLINFSLTGRGFLWRDMLSDYSTRDLISQLFGFGDSTSFVMRTWDHETDNPHNLPLAILINYGLLMFSLFAALVIRLFWSIGFKRRIILFAIFAAGMGNSNLFSFYHISITFIFIFTLFIDQNEYNSECKGGYQTDRQLYI